MADAKQHNESLALDLKEQIDQICDRFEAEWKSSRRPEIGAYIASSHGRLRTELLCELLAIELEYRSRLGEQLSSEEYDSRFPNDVAVISDAFENASARTPASSASTMETVDWSGTQNGRLAANSAAGQPTVPRPLPNRRPPPRRPASPLAAFRS